MPLRFLKDGMDFAFGTTNHESVDTEELNTVRYVDGFGGPSAVQAELDDVGATATPDSRPTVVVYGGGEAEWSNSIQVPNNVTVKATDNFSIRVPDSHTLDSRPIHGGEYDTLISNADFSGSAENITIEGFTVDYDGDPADGSTKEQAVNTGPIWLNQVTNGTVTDCYVKNVLPEGTQSGGSRQIGVFITDSEDVEAIGCVGENCGYEGVGLRGNIKTGRMVRCKGVDCGVHAVQVAYRTGTDVTFGGRPENILISECIGIGSDISIDGSSLTDPMMDIVVERCGGDNRISPIGHLQNITLRNNYVHHDVRGVANGTLIKGLTLDGGPSELNFDRPNPYPLYIRAGANDGCEVTDIVIQNYHLEDDTALMKVDASPVTVGEVTMRNCQNVSGGGDGLFTMYGGGSVKTLRLDSVYSNATDVVTVGASTIDTAHVQDSDFADVGNFLDTVNGGTITTLIKDGKGEAALGGVAPDATGWPEGTTVEDTDNPGNLYYIYDNSSAGGVSQIA